MNWPMKVVPAVWAVLFGLFRLRAGSTIRFTGPCSEIIFGVQDTPRLAKLHQGRMEFRTGCRKGAKLREQATKPVFRDNKPSMPGPLGVSSTARENARGARNHHTHTERSEELPSTDPTELLVLLRAHSVLLIQCAC